MASLLRCGGVQRRGVGERWWLDPSQASARRRPKGGRMPVESAGHVVPSGTAALPFAGPWDPAAVGPSSTGSVGTWAPRDTIVEVNRWTAA
jgi:hypothetical protein